MDLVGLVVPAERIHHEVDAEAQRQFALPLAVVARADDVARAAKLVLGPGLGSLIFSGLSRLGGANALEMALTGTILIVIIALIFDGLLVLLGRLTISKGLQ